MRGNQKKQKTKNKKKKKKKQHSFSQRRSHADPKPKFTQDFPTNKIIERNKEKNNALHLLPQNDDGDDNTFFFQERLGQVLGNVDATKGKDRKM
jgi:hypothetical protein